MLSDPCSQTVVVAVLATLLEYDYKIIQTLQKRYPENKGKGINTNRCRNTYAKHCCPNHHLSAKTFQQTGSPYLTFYSPKLWHVLSYCSFYQVYNYSSKPLLIQQLEICGHNCNCYQCSSCTSTTRFNVQNPAELRIHSGLGTIHRFLEAVRQSHHLHCHTTTHKGSLTLNMKSR